jgi:Domain of unknown function (DUF4276)
VKLFVEGGGDSKALRTECREAFHTWLRSVGLTSFPKIVASGSRNDAFKDFVTAIKNDEEAMLLVDSEDSVEAKHQQGAPENWLPWEHLTARDGWNKPAGSTDLDCHLMVECMENWFLGDSAKLASFFGQDFKANKLPAVVASIETITKTAVMGGLKQASVACKPKGAYGKGPHSFKILKTLDAKLVVSSAPWAARFEAEMKKRFP